MKLERLLRIESIPEPEYPIGIVSNVQGNVLALKTCLEFFAKRGISADRVVSAGNLIGLVNRGLECYEISRGFLANLTGSIEISLITGEPRFPLIPSTTAGKVYPRLEAQFQPRSFALDNWHGPRFKLGKHLICPNLTGFQFRHDNFRGSVSGQELWADQPRSLRPRRIITTTFTELRSREVLDQPCQFMKPDQSHRIKLGWHSRDSTIITLGASGFYRICHTHNKIFCTILSSDEVEMHTLDFSFRELRECVDFELM